MSESHTFVGRFGLVLLWALLSDSVPAAKAAGPQLRHSLQSGQDNGVQSVAFTPDSKTVAAACTDRAIRLWDAATGKSTAILKEHISGVREVAFSPDGRMLAAGCADGSIRLWEMPTRKLIGTLEAREHGVDCLSFSPDSKILAACAQSPTIELWDVADRKRIASIRSHSESVMSVA